MVPLNVLVIVSTSLASPPTMTVGVHNCSGATAGWTGGANGLQWQDGACATAVSPPSNDGLVIMAPCGGAVGQDWALNRTGWPTMPNASLSILLPAYPDDGNTDYGWTFSSSNGGPSVGAVIQLFDLIRFHGECTGHHNCGFTLTSTGQLETYFPGKCIAPMPIPTPAPHTQPTTTAPYSGAIEFAFAIQSNMVLQQAPAKAAVYGFVGHGDGDAAITVTVTGAGAGAYTVAATVADGKWKAFLRPAPAGGSYAISAKCTAGCTGLAEISSVTFGDVWYCGGQSNMALPVQHTFSRNISREAILAGKYDNIRIHGIAGNMNPDLDWTTLKDAVANASADMVQEWYGGHNEAYDRGTIVPGGAVSQFFRFSSTCYYFGESLTEQLGPDAPPIGLIHTAFGGSMIEEWLLDSVTADCGGATPSYKPQSLWDSAVVPYLDTTVKGWIWYQGENNCGGTMGNSAQKVGYGCMLPAMVDLWRKSWSAEDGTTDSMAPFGVVTLASGGSEGGSDIGGMRWSQTSNYGTLPSPAMPNTFLAHAFDLGDPWTNNGCQTSECCEPAYNATVCSAAHKIQCAAACVGLTNTSFYMGPIHPRVKKPVGNRLAQAAVSLVYKNGKGAFAGPTLAGCRVADKAITLTFNSTLLQGGQVEVKPYVQYKNSAMFVLVDGRFWCSNTTLTAQVGSAWPQWMCSDAGAPNWGSCGNAVMCGGGAITGAPAGLSSADDSSAVSGSADGPPPQTAWVQVNITKSGTASVTVDLAPLKGATPMAIRYAWGNDDGDSCCAKEDGAGATTPCTPAACPIWDPKSGLPGNPFIAKIESGKCACVAPQVCDA